MDLAYHQFGAPTNATTDPAPGLGRPHTIADLVLVGDPVAGWLAKIAQSELLLNATNLTIGTIPTARYGTGTIPIISLIFPGNASTWLDGTGNFTTPPVGMFDPMTAAGDMIFRNGVNVLARLQAGSNGQVLTIVGGIPAWQTPSGGGGGGTGTVTSVSVVSANGFSGSVATATTTPAITLTLQDATSLQDGKLTAANWTTFNNKMSNPMTTDGDLIYRAGGVPARLGIGSDGDVLTMVSGAPAWAAPSGGGGGWGLTGNAGTVDGTNFLGTTDNVPLTFRVNDVQAGRIVNNLRNTFLGYEAGLGNTDGESNTAIGWGALKAVGEGLNNTAIGTQALTACTTGEDNVAIGVGTLKDITTGANNTAFGTNTGLGITTGSSNTILGGNVTGLASGLSNNVIIADGAGFKRVQFDSSGFLTATLQEAETDAVNFLPWAQDAGGRVKRMTSWPGGGGTPDLQAVTDVGASTTNTVLCVGGTTGIVAQGSSFGGQMESTNTPLVVNNSSTANGVRTAILFQRSASFTAAGGDGFSLTFSTPNSAAVLKTCAEIQPFMQTVTAAAEQGAIRVNMMSAGSLVTRFEFDAAGMFTSEKLKTDNPGGGTAGEWKLGSHVTGSSGAALITTQYVELEVDGVVVKLGVISLP